MKSFTTDVVEWWVKWSRIHKKEDLKIHEAEEQLALLKELVHALKTYHR